MSRQETSQIFVASVAPAVFHNPCSVRLQRWKRAKITPRKKSRKLTFSNTDSLLIPLLPELIEIMDVIALKISPISYQMNKCECFGFEQMYFTQTLGWTNQINKPFATKCFQWLTLGPSSSVQ